MSNTPNNPFDPQPEKGPWLYSGAPQPTPAYTPPPTPPSPPSPAPVSPLPAQDNPPIAALAPAPASKIENPKSKTENPPEEASLAGIIDTIEAIIIALILALTFRAFIVEAFVIPTGSMAPTLLGTHFKVICPKCGYAFDRDASLRYQLKNGSIQKIGDRGELLSNRTIPADGDDHDALICPNCQYIIPYDMLPQALPAAKVLDERTHTFRPVEYPDVRTGSTRPVPFAWANNGDRILVLKYIYSVFEPHRFDVIVFKEPMTAQDNFIKRLIGLPEETIEIINGDIFVAPPRKTALEDRVIARKPPYLQKNLWQVIYDNDYYPTDENQNRRTDETPSNIPDSFIRWENPWRGAGDTHDAWYPPHPQGQYASIAGPVIHYQADAPGKLEFLVRVPYTCNILGYNNDIQDILNQRGLQTIQQVGDLHLEATWNPNQAAGTSIKLTAGARRNLFAASWSAKGLTFEHYLLAQHRWEQLQPDTAVDVPAPQPGRTYHVEFNNVDHELQFFIDGKMVLQHDVPWNAADAHKEFDALTNSIEVMRSAQSTLADRQQAEDLLATFKPQIALDVGGRCTLSHLKLMRDLYYTQNAPPARVPGAANTNFPLTLGKDEFFALGDNSRRSHDGRSWEIVYPALDDLGTRRGIVPRRYLLGKAFFVYWPAGYRLSSSVPPFSEIPLVPNVGDMRFIR